MKVGRNKPCPCGSGIKYKRCCGKIGGSSLGQRIAFSPKLRAKEAIRQQQQGLGRPIVSAEVAGERIVAIGSQLVHSKKWRVFADFLSDYLKTVFGSEWGKTELGKPDSDQHIVMQWYRAYCAYQAAQIAVPGEITSSPGTGVVWCYLGLAYSLYLIKHNVELQDILVRRLRDPKNFQGAYYELMVANVLIRAGFTLELEDEQDIANKHCEFSATSRQTGKKYWVEAKMRAVVGHLGKTAVDGSKGKDPTEKLTEHLRLAFKKPASDERLIFIDLNAPNMPVVDPPAWVARAEQRLSHSEKASPNDAAYVFVTNMSFHHHLEAEYSGHSVMAFGFNVIDFAKAGVFGFKQHYLAKLKHADAYNIIDAIRTYIKLPTTFDGRLPSEAFGQESNRVIVGEKYFFGDERNGFLVEVTSVSVSEDRLLVGVMKDDGAAWILEGKLTDAELAEYREHSGAYFGADQYPKTETNTPYELFEWLVWVHRKSPRETLIKMVETAPDFDALSRLSHDELVLEIAERLAATIARNKPSEPK